MSKLVHHYGLSIHDVNFVTGEETIIQSDGLVEHDMSNRVAFPIADSIQSMTFVHDAYSYENAFCRDYELVPIAEANRRRNAKTAAARKNAKRKASSKARRGNRK